MKKHFLNAMTDKPSNQALSRLDRRNFLSKSSIAVLGAFCALHAPHVLAQGNSSKITSLTPPQQFHQLATWISACPELNPDLSSKAFDTMNAVMPNFKAALEQLFTLLTDEDSLSSLLALVHRNQDLELNQTQCDLECVPLRSTVPTSIYTTSIKLIQNTTLALYTGQIGFGPNAHLIAYEHALMYAPTKDVISVPSYTHAGRDFWVEPPVA